MPTATQYSGNIMENKMKVTEEFIRFLRDVAHQRGLTAAYNGSHTDGGERELLTQIDLYIEGFNQTFPSIWENWAKEFARENDPEFAEYRRLKEKFA